MRPATPVEGFDAALRETGTAGDAASRAECTEAARRLRDGDLESWYDAWLPLAESVRRLGSEQLAAGTPDDARRTLIRASFHYRTAGRFLERVPLDPRLSLLEEAGTACFLRAMRFADPVFGTVRFMHQGARRVGFLRRETADERPRRTVVAVGRAIALDELHALCAETALAYGWNCLGVAGGAEEGDSLVLAAVEAAAGLAPVDPSCLMAMEVHRGEAGALRSRLRAAGDSAEVLGALRSDAPALDALTAADADGFRRAFAAWVAPNSRP